MNRKIKIIADDKIPFLKGVLEPYANIEYYPGKDITKEKIIDADALIVRTRTKCNKDLLSGTKIKIVTTATIGTDHIDINYCEKNNIKWLNAPGCNSTSVMQYVTAALLTLAEMGDFYLDNKTIGIVGVGNVGSKIQRIAELLGMKVLLNDPPRERKEGGNQFCSLRELINESDIITFHVPLNKSGLDQTYHLADEKFFSQLEKKPIIINSSRGEVIKTSALKNAINNGKISKTVLDVWENEPKIDLELLELVDFGTPHIAGYSLEGKANGTSVCVNAVNEFFKLGLKRNWYPKEIPFPEIGNSIEIECKNKTDQYIIKEAVLRAYNILEDDERLRKSPDTFEKQRGDYPIRREFNNYTVKLRNCESRVNEQLAVLGFNIKCD
jgi:erythronate-4-phosphate dehydrogenase